MVETIIVDGSPKVILDHRGGMHRRFYLIDGGGYSSMTLSLPKWKPEPDDFSNAMVVLEAKLEGENWFLERIRSMVRRSDGIEDDDIPLDKKIYPQLAGKTGHDSLIHLAQFFFLLNALRCTEPEQIEAFIKSHNDKIEAELKSDRPPARVNELKKAVFKSARKAQIRDTFQHYGRPVFAISEIGHLLFDIMSPTTTTNLITDLLAGGVLVKPTATTDDPPIATDPRRVLVEPTREFNNAYVHSLLETRRRIFAKH